MPQKIHAHSDAPNSEPTEEFPLGFDPTRALDTVKKITRENPHAALIGAATIGFVLGGGMTPKLVGAIAMFTARRYFRVTVEETISSLQATLEGQHEPES